MALGYHISLDKPPSRIRSIRLPNDPFLQPNGYKPAPLDLSAITLTPKLEELIDQLAENTHNIWSKERIMEGWTYGLNEVTSSSFNFLMLYETSQVSSFTCRIHFLLSGNGTTYFF